MATLYTVYPPRVRFPAPSPSPDTAIFKLFCKSEPLRIRRKHKKMTVVKAELNFSRIISDAVQSFQLYPATWESAILSNTLIFLAGSPLLFAGLTKPGISAAFLLGSLSWRAFGSRGFLTVVIYYLIGTGVTKLKLKQKEAEGVAEKRKGRRGPSSVFGSGAAGCLCALASITELGGLAFVNLWQLGFVASFCTKLSDTVSSEIGKAYGKTTYLITTRKVVPRGTEGAVSIEGTFSGLAASMLLACVCWLMGQAHMIWDLEIIYSLTEMNTLWLYQGITLSECKCFEICHLKFIFIYAWKQKNINVSTSDGLDFENSLS